MAAAAAASATTDKDAPSGGPDQDGRGDVSVPPQRAGMCRTNNDADQGQSDQDQQPVTGNESSAEPAAGPVQVLASSGPRRNVAAVFDEDEPCAVCFDEFEGHQAVKQLPCGELD